MTLLAAAGRIGTTLLAMAGARLELAAVEFQEDTRRLLGYLAWSLLAVLLAAGAILLAALFVILLCWDSYRLQAVAGMAAVLGIAALLVVAGVRSKLKARTPLFAATLAELRDDLAQLRHAAHAHAGAVDD